MSEPAAYAARGKESWVLKPVWVLNESYDVERLRYLLPHIDGLILMSVEPGYGGQPFEESIYEKVKRSVEIMDETGIHVPISIDGGVNTVTGKKLVEAGADILIAEVLCLVQTPLQMLLRA